MSITMLNKYLKDLPKEKLIELIKELYYLNNANCDFLKNKCDPQHEKNILEKYKKKIDNEFKTKKGYVNLSFSNIRKNISEFNLISKQPLYMAELLFHYVKTGVDFTNEFGDIDEKFYNSIELGYKNLLEFIFKNGIQNEFKEKCFQIQQDSYGIGWGFSDYMSELYYSFFIKENN